MAKSFGEQLDDVQKAIEVIEGGAQQYEINGRKFIRGNLEAYYKERDRLEMKVEQYGADYTIGQNRPRSMRVPIRFSL